MSADLSPRARTVGVVVWCSFLAACGATAILFALFDPVMLWQGGDRRTTYALGFFFFWAVAAISAALSTYMARGR